MSIPAGNLLQVAGLAAGAALLWLAAGFESPRPALVSLLAGWLLIYFSCHAIAHWLVGRLLGIRFRCYTLGGTAKPDAFPAGLRWVFERLPFLGVQSEKASLQTASSARRAAMFSAGVTSSVVLPTLAALWAWQAHVRGGFALFVFTLAWSVGTVITNLRPGGDYWKARRALKTL